MKVRIYAFDSETGEPIAFARVEIWKDNQLIAYGSTDANGYDTLDIPEPGEYIIVLKSQLWKPVRERVRITSEGTIKISSFKAAV